MAVKVDDPRDIQQSYDDFGASTLKHAESNANNPNSSYADAGSDQAEAFANDPDNASDPNDEAAGALRDQEGAGAGGDANWAVNRDASAKAPQSDTRQFITKLAKKGGIPAVLTGSLIGGFTTLTGFFGLATLPTNITENASQTNDSSSSMMQRRFLKVFRNVSTNDNNEFCKTSTVKTIRCKMGRMSNNSIKALNKRGVISVIDGQDYNGKTTGYPDKNPEKFKFPDGRGGHIEVESKDLSSFLLRPENREIANRVMGVGGAFNMKFKSWASKVITKKFYNPFGLKRDGGLADGSERSNESESERRNKTLAALRERIPLFDKLAANFPTKIEGKMEEHMRRAGKAGTAYTLMVASCIGIKLPVYIATGIAAIQLARLLPYAMDIALSPSSKQKAASIDSGFTSGDADRIGTVLTSQDKNGQSAMDSPYLLAAMGINKNPPAPATNIVPGLSAMNSGIVVASAKADKSTKSACNAIMSPSAMYAAMAVEGAATVAASATIIGGILKLAAGFIIGEIATKIVTEIAGNTAQQVLEYAAESDVLEKAEGKELGDVLGVSLTAFFSAGGMARGIPALKTSQVAETQAIMQQEDQFQREMAVASLSPFDTSSRYTFLGSIMYSAQMAAMQSGGYNGSIGATLAGLAQLPGQVLSSKVGAFDDFSVKYCSYADDIALDTTNASDTPAINMAGMPCVGLTTGAASMSTEHALQLISDEGWIDLDKEGITDGMTMDEMVKSGFIVDETPLSEFIASCTDSSNGDYLINSAGCTVSSPRPAGSTDLGNGCWSSTDKDGKETQVCSNQASDGEEDTRKELKNPDSLQAISVFLLDYQVMQAMMGEDDPTSADVPAEAAPAASAVAAGDMVFYTQGSGAPWAQDIYVDEPYAMEGCGPTAAAMVIATFKDKTVTPKTTGEWMAARPEIPFQGSELPKVFANWGLQSETFEAGSAGAEDKILQALRDGKLVVVSGQGGTPFTSGGHFIVLRGLEGDKILIGDPANADNNTKPFDQATIFDQYHNAVNIITKP